MSLSNENFYLINIPPLFSILLFFIVGIIFHYALFVVALIFCIIASAVFLFYKYQIFFPKKLLLYSFFVLLGATLHQKELYDYHTFYTLIDGRPVTINGTVIDKSTAIIHKQESTVLTLAITLITTKNDTYKSNKTIILHMPKTNNTICVGDSITFFNVCCKKPLNQSFQRYQIKEQILSTVFEHKPHYTIDYHPSWSIRRWIWYEKNRILNTLSVKLSPQSFQFFASLFLGNRVCVKESLESTNEQFKIWGISHFLARSGLHLALFILIWQTIFSIIPFSLLYKQLIISALSGIYFIFTWTSTPFTRSFALFLINKTCLLTKTSFHLLHYLTVVAFCFLLYCPLYLFFLDFQLSFGLTFALAWFNLLSAKYNTNN